MRLVDGEQRAERVADAAFGNPANVPSSWTLSWASCMPPHTCASGIR
jgi:hypothetical protein